MNRTESVLVGMAVGAGLVYFLDPDRGARRRALIRDQVVHAGHELEERARAEARHARNRAAGLAHEVRAGVTEKTVDDRVLEERVRSEAGRSVSHPGALEITARAGTVILSGEILSEEVQGLVRAVKAVRGVEHVDNRLGVSTNPERTPSLQGARSRDS